MDTLKKRMKVDIRLGCIAVYPEDMKPSCLNNIGDHDDCIHRRRGTMVGGKYTINPKHVIVAQAVCDRWNACAGIENPGALAKVLSELRSIEKRTLNELDGDWIRETLAALEGE